MIILKDAVCGAVYMYVLYYIERFFYNLGAPTVCPLAWLLWPGGKWVQRKGEYAHLSFQTDYIHNLHLQYSNVHLARLISEQDK